jgi:hypothetical protein
MAIQINIGNDRSINDQEWKKIEDAAKKNPGEQINLVDDKGQVITSKSAEQLAQLSRGDLNSEVASTSDANSPADAELASLKTEMEQMTKQINDLQQKGVEQDQIQEKQAALQKMLEQANALIKQGAKPIDLSKYNKAAGLSKNGQNGLGAKAQMTSGGATSDAASTQNAQTYGNTGGFTGPANWGAQSLGGGMPMFNSDTFMKTMAMENNIMSSWDQVNKNTSRGKQLMMLFFYFAKMAESGSMDAMYQFMKFITYIISKDKAKQQIEMGKKLIQLQELSRSWTNKLLNVESNTADPAASNELMKTMTIVKSETDAIATSQKLISQMMEEFAQVVETLTNTTKAALETAGRIKRTVSTMR